MNDATLKDVALHAGVSITTVSRVLHNNGYASPQVRRRVEIALRESGYRLNAVAQDLRRRRTITLGVIIHGGLSNPFYAEIAMGAEQAAAEQGFDVSTGSSFRRRSGPTMCNWHSTQASLRSRWSAGFATMPPRSSSTITRGATRRCATSLTSAIGE